MHSNFWVLEECCHRMLFSPYRIPAYTPSKPQFGSFGLDQGLNACILIEKHTTIKVIHRLSRWLSDAAAHTHFLRSNSSWAKPRNDQNLSFKTMQYLRTDRLVWGFISVFRRTWNFVSCRKLFDKLSGEDRQAEASSQEFCHRSLVLSAQVRCIDSYCQLVCSWRSRNVEKKKCSARGFIDSKMWVRWHPIFSIFARPRKPYNYYVSILIVFWKLFFVAMSECLHCRLKLKWLKRYPVYFFVTIYIYIYYIHYTRYLILYSRILYHIILYYIILYYIILYYFPR